MTELVDEEKNRLNAALTRLEGAIEKYTEHSQGKAVTAATKNTSSEMDSLRDQVKSFELQVVRKNEEVSHLSADVVRLTAEVNKLRDVNRKTANMLGNSIKEIEELVS